MDRGYCFTAVIGGLLGEVVLRNGRYKSVKHARLAFSVQSIYGLGNWLPIYFARDAYIRQMLDMGYGEEYTQKNDECFAELDASADCDFRNARRVHRLHDRHKNVEETFCKSRHGRGGNSVHSEKFKLDFRTKNVDVIVSFVYSDPGKYTNEIFDCGGSLFAAAICTFLTLEQGKEKRR